MTTASAAPAIQREPGLPGQTVVVIGGSPGIGLVQFPARADAELREHLPQVPFNGACAEEQLGAVTARRGWRRHSPPGAAGGRSRPTWVSRSANPTER